ncbi:MAG: putative rane protein YckC, family [Firmicutes bacterium]|nr:putative rane protein YckC, family [Bacillota bacterium]
MEMPFPPALPEQPRYAGFWIRLLAYILDAIVLGAITYPLVRVLSSMGIGDSSSNILSIAISWMYFAVFESSEWMASPGKKVLGLIVTDEQGMKISIGRATRRYLAKIVSGLILGIGFIMIAFTARKQGLHDKIFHTLVLRTKY